MIRGQRRQDKTGWRGQHKENREGIGIGREPRYKTLIQEGLLSRLTVHYLCSPAWRLDCRGLFLPFPSRDVPVCSCQERISVPKIVGKDQRGHLVGHASTLTPLL